VGVGGGDERGHGRDGGGPKPKKHSNSTLRVISNLEIWVTLT